MAESRVFSHLVVVGSSAGGIEALSRLLGSLPEDFPAPVVIAQHTHPERESHLQEIFAREARLPVRTVSGTEPLESGTVFVVTANRHVSITDKKIEVSEDGRGRPKPSIDLLLTSASQAYGENLIAVILSGTGTDGTDGARAVKQAGGTVVIQDPGSAEFSGMPGSLAPNTVDIVVDLDRIGSVLSDLLSSLSGTGFGAESGAEVSREPDEEGEERPLSEFLEDLKESHGIDFGEYKRPTIRRRLRRRFAATGVEDLAEYRRYLEENPDEYRQLINAFLIKVTEFYRDPEQFEYLRAEVLPGLIERARQSGEQLRMWSAGCATGEEAYSLAILVRDALSEPRDRSTGTGADERTVGLDVRIFATDLDEGAVDHARRGVYPASALSALSEEQVSRYFEQTDGLYYVRQSIRSMIIFGEHDLAQRSPFPRLDLVVSRNVLIYFTPELQKRTLQLFAFSLKNKGYLMLGASESTSPLPGYFAPLDRQNNVFQRQGDRFVMPASSLPEPAPRPPRGSTHGPAYGPAYGPAHGRHSLRPLEIYGSHSRQQDEAPAGGPSEEAVLSRLPVGVVVVDERYYIQLINPAARRLLSVHGAGVGEDLLHLVREAPYDELRSAINAALRDGESAPTGEFDVEDIVTGELRTLKMHCYPSQESEAHEVDLQEAENEPAEIEPSGTEPFGMEFGESEAAGTVTILVEEVTGSSSIRRDLEGRLETNESEFEEYRRQAEEDNRRRREQNGRLVEGNRQLDETNRRLRRAVGELRASNEHYQLSSAEAQASVEEVETLNEELQATNEELETVNEELQATVEELNTSNDSLQERSTELQNAVRQSEQEQAQLQAILESIPEAMVVVEASGEALLNNEAYRHTFPGGCVARDDSGDDLPEEQTPQGRAASGETFTMEFTATGPEGTTRRYEAKSNTVGDRSRRGAVIIFRDITRPATEDGDPEDS